MEPKIKHSWDLSYKEALALQRELQKKVVLNPLPLSKISIIAGADISYSKEEDINFAGVVIFSFPDLKILEKSYFISKPSFPYIPGLLVFREGPAILEAFKKIKNIPDLIVFDGHGIAHPRGLGIASHMGVILNIPTIGCAKSKLCGEYTEPENRVGAYSLLKYKNKVVGAVLRSKKNSKPIFISPGFMIDLESSIKIIMLTLRGYRIPEVTRIPHIYVNKLRENFKK